MLVTGGHLRLGELLLDVGVVKQEDIMDALRIAEQRRLPIGRALVMKGCLSDHLLQSALQAQSLYRDGLITKKETIQALQSVVDVGIEFDRAVEQARLSSALLDTPHSKTGSQEEIKRSLEAVWRKGADLAQSAQDLIAKKRSETRNRLGELLVAAGVLTELEVQKHLSKSVNSGLPLGRYLVSLSVVSESLVMVALNVQMLIRDWKVTREQGIQLLQAAAKRQTQAEQSHTMDLPCAETMYLGELLVMSGVLSKAEVVDAVETSLLNQEKLGQVLLRFGMVTNEELQSALMLQSMVSSGKIRPHKAVQAMSFVHTQGLSGSEALNLVCGPDQKSPEAISLETFIRLSGILSRKEIEQAVQTSMKESIDPVQFGTVIVEQGLITNSFLRDCQRLHTLVCGGILSLERSIVVLKHCLSSGKNARHCIEELGWNLPG